MRESEKKSVKPTVNVIYIGKHMDRLNTSLEVSNALSSTHNGINA